MKGIVATPFARAVRISRQVFAGARIAARRELVFKESLGADTNHGDVYPNDGRPDDRSIQILLRTDGIVSSQSRFDDHQNDTPIPVA